MVNESEAAKAETRMNHARVTVDRRAATELLEYLLGPAGDQAGYGPTYGRNGLRLVTEMD